MTGTPRPPSPALAIELVSQQKLRCEVARGRLDTDLSFPATKEMDRCHCLDCRHDCTRTIYSTAYTTPDSN